MAKVVGTVTVNGEPLSKANVLFAPESGQRVASGGTDDEGHFRPTWKPLYAAHNVRIESWSKFISEAYWSVEPRT